MTAHAYTHTRARTHTSHPAEMASLAEDRTALGRDRQAFAVRETQLAAFIASLGLRVPAPAPGAATAMRQFASGAADGGAAAVPPPAATALTARGAPSQPADATPAPLRDGGARAGFGYMSVSLVAQQQMQALRNDAAAAAEARGAR